MRDILKNLHIILPVALLMNVIMIVLIVITIAIGLNGSGWSIPVFGYECTETSIICVGGYFGLFLSAILIFPLITFRYILKKEMNKHMDRTRAIKTAGFIILLHPFIVIPVLTTIIVPAVSFLIDKSYYWR